MKHTTRLTLLLAAACAPELAVAQTRTSLTLCPKTTAVVGDTFVVQKAASPTLICIAKKVPPVVTSPVVVPPAMPSASDEPFYSPGNSTLVLQDSFDRYADAVSMGAYPFVYAGPILAPNPAPSQTSTPVDVAHVSLIPGRSGKALRLSYDGLYQESHSLSTLNIPAQPDNATVFIQYWARVTTPTNWPLTQSLAVKWIEAWHNHAGAHGGRIQWNMRYPSPANPTQKTPTVWQVIDNAESTTNGDQPVGPYFAQIADGQWHRFTYAFHPHTSTTVRDGFAKAWIDGVKIIDIEKATIGVTPLGGRSPWCAQADVDDVATADGVANLAFGGPQTTVTGPWTYDIDDLLWWRQ